MPGSSSRLRNSASGLSRTCFLPSCSRRSTQPLAEPGDVLLQRPARGSRSRPAVDPLLALGDDVVVGQGEEVVAVPLVPVGDHLGEVVAVAPERVGVQVALPVLRRGRRWVRARPAAPARRGSVAGGCCTRGRRRTRPGTAAPAASERRAWTSAAVGERSVRGAAAPARRPADSRLHQQPQRVAEELREAGREPAAVGAVDDAVVVGQATAASSAAGRSGRPAPPAAGSTATGPGSRPRGSSRSA